MGDDTTNIDNRGNTRGWSIAIQLMACAFTVWAGVVFWAAKQVVQQVDQIITRQESFQNTFNEYVVGMEKRVTTLELYEKIQDEKRDRLRVEFDEFRTSHQFHEIRK